MQNQGTRTSQPAPNVLIQQSPLPPSSQHAGQGGYGQPVMVSYAAAGPRGGQPSMAYSHPGMGPQGPLHQHPGQPGGPRPMRGPYPPGYPPTSSPLVHPGHMGGSPVFTSVPSPANQPAPVMMQAGPGGPGGPGGHPAPFPQAAVPPSPADSAAANLASLLAASGWTSGFWAAQGDGRPGLECPAGLERLDSHSPLSLARLGNARVNTIGAKAVELFHSLAKRELDVPINLHKADQIQGRTKHLLDVRRQLDSLTALLGKLVQIQQLLAERRPSGSGNATRAYLDELMALTDAADEAEEGPGEGPGEEPGVKEEAEDLSPAHRRLRQERDQKRREIAEKDALLRHAAEQLRWLHWQIGASLSPV